MLEFRNIVTTFLTWNDKMLLMKRGSNRKIAPNLWFGVGGHMEPEEINNPYRSMYREILEETGIDKKGILELNLRYIVYSRDPEIDEMVVNHIFFGKVKSPYFRPNDEGSLHWIEKDQVLKRPYHPAMKWVLERYINYGEEEMLFGVVDWNKLSIHWHPL